MISNYMIKLLREFLCTLYKLWFIDMKTGLPSHTKMWSNFGYLALIITFMYAVIFGSKADIMLWLLFGVVVVGNRTIIKLFGRDR